VIDLIPSSVDPTLPLESKYDTTHVFLVDTKSTMLEGIPPSPIEPPPSNEAILFYWGALIGPCLPSHFPFNIRVHDCGRDIPQMLIEEGKFVSILFSISWKSLGYPQLVSVTQNMLAFNRRTSHTLRVLPHFPITLRGKNFFIHVMVVQDPLDFYLLLGRDYIYAMKSIMSTLFCLISFPHNGRIMTIDQLSFIGHDFTINSMTSLNGSYMQTIFSPPQVNYVELSPMPSTSDADEPLTVSSISSNLDPVVDMVISWVGLLEPKLLTLIATLDMCSLQRAFVPSSKDLLEAMTEFCPLTWFPSGASSSWNS
jgi:hypothetical protein